MSLEPPKVGAAFPVLLPQVDADGNEIAGLRSPELAVPLATYMGWQLYNAGARPRRRARELARLVRAVPARRRRARAQPATRGARSSSAIPIASAILALVEQAAKPLIADGYLRAEDLARIVAQAGERWRVLVEERAQR